MAKTVAAQLSEDESSQAFKDYQQAQENGGPCKVCGWRDGDGAKTCFYSKELGAVTHSNTERSIEKQMTPAQRSLYKLGYQMLYISMEEREKDIQEVYEYHLTRRKEHEASDSPRPFVTDENRNPMSDEEWIARYRRQAESKPTADEEPYRHWVQKAGMKHFVDCYEPHPDCGGIKIMVGPYHFRCSKCNTEVKLWEFGVDYDIG